MAPDRNAADSRVSTGPDAIQPGRGGSMGRTMVVWTRDFLMAVAYFIAALMGFVANFSVDQKRSLIFFC
jgi:hypothetical protein